MPRPAVVILNLILLLRLAMSCPEAVAQTNGVTLHHYSTDNGLSHNQITAMAEDENGMLWLGTGNGVNRFDGYEFIDFSRSAPSGNALPNAYVQEMFLLPGNQLFIRYMNNSSAAQLLNTHSGALQELSLQDGMHGTYAGSWQAGGQLYSVWADKKYIYVYTLDRYLRFNYLLRIQQNEKQPEPPGDYRHFSFTHIPHSPGHFLLLTPNLGILKVDASGRRLKHFDPSQLRPVYRDQIFPGLHIGEDSAVLIHDNFSTGSPIYLYYDKKADSLIKKSLPEASGEASTPAAGPVSEKNRFRQMVSRYLNLIPNSGHVLLSRNADQLYISKQQGFVALTPERKLFTAYLNNSAAPWEPGIQCRGICRVNQNRVMIATEKHGLWLINPDTKTNEQLKLHPPGLSSSPMNISARNLMPENDSVIWVSESRTHAKGGSLRRIDLHNRQNTFYPVDYTVNNAHRMRNGDIWIATEPEELMKTHLFVFLPEGRQFREIILGNAPASMMAERPACFYEAGNGSIWYATENGLYLINRKSNLVEKAFFSSHRNSLDEQFAFPVQYTLPAPHVMVIQETNKGWLCLGTNGGGVIFLNPKNGQVYVLTTQNGLADNHVCSILSDGREWWLGTWKGLSAYHPGTGSFRNFFTTDGLPGNEFNRFSAYRDQTGMLWMGGQRGCIAFLPNQLPYTDRSARLILSEMGFFDPVQKALKPRYNGFDSLPVVKLPATQRNFYCKLSLSDLSDAQDNRYEYLLIKDGEHTSEQWKSTGSNRMISFDYLPSGNYMLLVRGKRNNKTEPTNMIRIRLQVGDYFYNTWWFAMLAALTTASLLYLLYRYRLRQAIRLERMRTRISSDLHDEVGSLLSGVALQMELLQRSADEKQRPVIRRIAETSRNAMSRMRDVVWTIDARKNSTGDLLEKMKEYAQELLTPLGIEYHFDESIPAGRTTLKDETKQHLYLIFKEFLNNTAKHAGATEIWIFLNIRGRLLELRLQDNGKGMQPDKAATTGQGLSNMQMRSALIRGKLTFHTKNGFGITLQCPL